MASSVDFLTYVFELLRKVPGLTYKKMMGEFLLYADGVLFGGIYDNRFLIKKTPSTEVLGLHEAIPYPSAKPMLVMDFENADEAARIVIDAVSDLKR